MNPFILLLAIYGLTFALRETDGPWDLMARGRNRLMRLPWLGVQVYKLLNCPFCTGWWAGLAIYWIDGDAYKWSSAVVWGLAGGAGNLILDGLLARLHRE
jgi:hypothetical protein